MGNFSKNDGNEKENKIWVIFLFNEALIDELKKKSDSQEEYLKKLVKNPNIVRHNKQFSDSSKQLRFLISRQWNSWYPSYFNSEGGCYAITTRDQETDPYKNNGVIVVDPGIGFMVSLRKFFHIEPQDIKKIFISHFHPDHMAGLIEFATLSYESEFPCDVYLNSTSYSFFRAFQGKYLHIHEIKPGQVKRVFEYNYQSPTYPNKITKESAYVKIINTHHSEISHRHNSLGFIFDFQLSILDSSKTTTGPLKKYSQKVGIMGDTDGNEHYVDEYIENFSDVDILILHLGSITSKKFGVGDAHLYLEGVQELLDRWNVPNTTPVPKRILLSEFGLELGTTNDIANLLSPLLDSHGFSLFLSQGKAILDSKEATDIEMSAHLIDKIWTNLKEKIKIEIQDEQLDEIICTLALFSLAVSRDLSLNYIRNPNVESQSEVKKELTKLLSQIFTTVIRSRGINNSSEHIKQIKETAEILCPKCENWLLKIPGQSNSEECRERIGTLYMDLFRHAAFHDIFLKTSEKMVYQKFKKQSPINGKENDHISTINKINIEISKLDIQQISSLSKIVFSSISAMTIDENFIEKSTGSDSKIILTGLTHYFSESKIPVNCVNAGGYIQLFENAFIDTPPVTFNFVNRERLS